MYKILIIEDDDEVREGLIKILSKHYEIEFAENGVEGLKKAIRTQPDVILLDLKMPEMDGFQTCSALRRDAEFKNVPIIILSAFNNVSDRVKLFDIGADDYLTKPFDRDELVSRIQRALSRSKASSLIGSKSKLDSIKLENLKIDIYSHEVYIEDNLITLSAIEFKIFHLLASNLDRLVTRESIKDYAWEKQNVSSRLIDSHILALRGKIKNYKFSIQSVYRSGYILKSL